VKCGVRIVIVEKQLVPPAILHGGLRLINHRGVEALAAERWTFNPKGESSSLSGPIDQFHQQVAVAAILTLHQTNSKVTNKG
jgi:hypothetical protein